MFDRAFFKFLLGFLLILAFSIGVIAYTHVNHASAQTALININTASLAELDTLPGVGPATAQSIINERPYATKEEISRADGIGEAGSSSYENIINLITVGDAPPVDNNDDDNNETATTTPETITTTSGGGGGSSHSSYAYIYRVDKEEPFKISAGRDRLGVTGIPLEFQAETESYDGNVSYKWSFGDGYEEWGKYVQHAYEYPGTYTVILNSSNNRGPAVSRAKVEIIEPQLSIVEANPSFITVENNAEKEVNLYGFKMLVGDKTFEFPQDTILAPQGIVRFSRGATGLAPLTRESVILGTYKTKNIVSNSSSIDPQALESVYTQALAIKNQLETLARASTPRTSQTPATDTRNPNLASVVSVLSTSTSASSEEEDRGWLEVVKNFFLER